MTNNAHRIVIDTNVLLSALVFGGKPRSVVDLLARGLVEFVISEAILSEMRRKITDKFPDFSDDLERMEMLLEQDAELVKLGTITITVCRDPDDNHILETAVIGGCDIIVSGDKDLLSLQKYQDIQIIQPTKLLRLVG